MKLAVPKTALVSGFCDEERSYLVLRYKEGEANRAVVFYLRHKGSQTLFENIETIIKLDSSKFPGAKLANGKNWNLFFLSEDGQWIYFGDRYIFFLRIKMVYRYPYSECLH